MVVAKSDIQEVVRNVANRELGCRPIAAEEQLTIRHAMGDKEIQSASCFAWRRPRTVADGSVRVGVYGRAKELENPRFVVRDEHVIEMPQDLQSVAESWIARITMVALDDYYNRPRGGQPSEL
jgi:hypothetical protein